MDTVEELKDLIRRVAMVTGASAFAAHRQDAVRVIMIHEIGEMEYAKAVFRAQMQYIRRHFSVVALGEAVDRLVNRRFRDEVVLTFDDGCRNTVDVAYPILQEMGLPATIFVCPGLIEKGQWLWTHESRARLRSLPAPAVAKLANELGAPVLTADPLVEWMKKLPLPRRTEVEEAIRGATREFVPSEAQKRTFDIMTWSQLESLDPALITIGAHTLNHPVLTTVDPDCLEDEIRGSRKLIERKLGRQVPFFCYPDGKYDDRVLSYTRSAFQAAVTTQLGVARADTPLHQIPRVPFADSAQTLAWWLYRNGA